MRDYLSRTSVSDPLEGVSLFLSIPVHSFLTQPSLRQLPPHSFLPPFPSLSLTFLLPTHIPSRSHTTTPPTLHPSVNLSPLTLPSFIPVTGPTGQALNVHFPGTHKTPALCSPTHVRAGSASGVPTLWAWLGSPLNRIGAASIPG